MTAAIAQTNAIDRNFMFSPPARSASDPSFDCAKIARCRSGVKQIVDVGDEFRFAKEPVIDTTQEPPSEEDI
jgi:hypothetical protein